MSRPELARISKARVLYCLTPAGLGYREQAIDRPAFGVCASAVPPRPLVTTIKQSSLKRLGANGPKRGGCPTAVVIRCRDGLEDPASPTLAQIGPAGEVALLGGDAGGCL